MQAIAILVPTKAIAFFLIALLSISCSGLSEYDTQQVELALGDSLLNSTESWGFSMNIIEDGVLRMNMNGAYSYNIQQNGENQTKISGPVLINIFDEAGSLESTVVCDSAFYEPDEGRFQMFRNVDVTTEDGKNLRSEYLLWERNIDKVSTPEFVIFISPPDSIAANGFYGNSDLTNYTLNEGGGKVVIE
jgi:LPS export ABC transporter protein LptC